MGQPAARITDMHTCPMVTGVVPHVGGPIIPPCAITVLTGKLPQARVTDMAICVGPPDMIVKGSMTVLVNNLPAARMGDMTAHGGVIVKGEFTVLIGDAGGAGGGGGGGAGAASGASGSFDIAAQAAAFINLATSGPYFPKPAEQAQTLIAAAKAGAPFCERCAELAAARARSALGEGKDAAKAAAAAAAKTSEKYGKAIAIEGDEAFRKKVIADLDAIKKTPTGAKLLEEIDKSGKAIKIVKTEGGNAVSGLTKGALKNADGTNGAGSDSTVKYNPDRKKIGDKDWETRPPAIGLAHELVHAQHAAEGSIDMSQVDNDSKPSPSDPKTIAKEKLEEVRTAGIPPHDKEPFSENKIRSEWDPKQPERKWY